MPKRAPIDYRPQFGGDMFRPRNVVEQELAVVAEVPSELQGVPVEKSVRSSERTNGRTNERTVDRIIVRHSFDIGQDQLLALAEIQMQRFNETGKKPKLGPLVQEALDQYIAKHRKRANGRTDGRTNGRTNE